MVILVCPDPEPPPHAASPVPTSAAVHAATATLTVLLRIPSSLTCSASGGRRPLTPLRERSHDAVVRVTRQEATASESFSLPVVHPEVVSRGKRLTRARPRPQPVQADLAFSQIRDLDPGAQQLSGL